MKLGLLAKMSLYILIPSLVGLGLVAGVSHQMSENALRKQTRQDIAAILKGQEVGLNAVFQSMKEALAQIAENRRLRLYLESYAKNPVIDHNDELFLHAIDALKNFTAVNSNIATCGLIAPDGKVIVHSKKGDTQKFSSTIGDDFSKRTYFINGMKGETSSVGLVSVATKKMTTIIGMPVMDKGKIVGVIYGGTDNDKLAAATTNKIDMGDVGMAFVVNTDGVIVQHPDLKRIGQKEENSSWVGEVIKNRKGRLEFVNSEGREKILYYTDMPEERWILCLELDKKILFAPISTMLINNALLAAGCALLVGMLIFLIVRGMVRLLGGLSGLAGAIAGGRLECTASEEKLLRTAENRGDELSVLSLGMEHMMANIKRLLGESEEKTAAANLATEKARMATEQAEEAARKAESARREGMLAAASQLEGVASVLASASTRLSDQIGQSEQAVSESAQRLAEAATAMNEMNATVQEVARNASAASVTSDETRGSAENGSEIVQKALQSIGEVRQVSHGLKNDMAELNAHAQSIDRIMGVISDIADQTNLLALNAAIEAARAGDAGRGFAVVADEVRKLAEKTMASTHDVGNAISAIQTSTAKSVEAMEVALRQVEVASEFAGQSGEALVHIVNSVELAADQVRAIATASEQQSATSDEINQTLVKINNISGQTASAMDEAAKAVTDLTRQAQALSDLIAEMKQG